MAELHLRQNLQADEMKTDLRIPFFYGEEKEDATNVAEFIEWFETSTTFMGLVTPAQKAAHFGSFLRGAAYQVHRSLDFVDVDPNDWNAVKAYFLKKFRRESSAHNIIATLDTLTQKKGEGIMQFYARVVCVTRLFTDTFHLPADKMPSNFVALPADTKTLVQRQCKIQMAQFVDRTYFIGGINSSIRTELQRIAPF